MIFYLSTREHQYTVRWFLDCIGRGLAGRVRLLPYEELFTLRRLPVGSYIFSDIDRLTPWQTDAAAAAWIALAQSGQIPHLLNNPIRAMRRFELLRSMHERGINDFDVYRLTESRKPRRFPVFIRCENSHQGSLSPLLNDQAELDAAIEALLADGRNREDKLIIEFCDVADARRRYHKYGAFVVGSRIVASHLDIGTEWQIKENIETFLDGEEEVRDERRYVQENPHQELLRPIFQLARIDYGRVDYAFADGQLRVFEINTNPTIIDFVDGGGPIWRSATETFARNFQAALEAIDCRERPLSNIPVRYRIDSPLEMWSNRVRRGNHRLLHALGLLRYEAPMVSVLRDIKNRLFGRGRLIG